MRKAGPPTRLKGQDRVEAMCPPEVKLNLKVQLARQGKTMLDVAKGLNCAASTLSTWMNGVAPLPVDLLTRIERVLNIPKGSLRSPAP